MSDVDLVFSALADPTRRHLIEALAATPGATATGLASGLPISRQAVSKHLGALRAADLVSVAKVGREARYSLETAPLGDATDWVEAVGREWDRRLAKLRRIV